MWRHGVEGTTSMRYHTEDVRLLGYHARLEGYQAEDTRQRGCHEKGVGLQPF